MSTMLSFSDNSLSNGFMTKDDIAKVCPSALKQAPTNPNVSSRYVFANTETVIDDLEKLGWYPVEAKQCRMRKNSNGIRSFHMLAFQNPNVYISKKNDDGSETIDCYPRIILTNSHDGFNSFRFLIGLFRLVCSNGLVIATDKFADIYVRHTNYDFEELRKVVATATEQVYVQSQVMNNMLAVEMTEEQKIKFATDAIAVRQGNDKKADISLETIKEILQPTRVEDEGNSLWNVFNVVQEHLIRGGYRSKSNTNSKMRRARAITSVAKDISINQGLFRLANEYAVAAAA